MTIDVLNDIRIDDTLASGAVRLSGKNGGTLTLRTALGSVSGAGRLRIFGDGIQASAGKLAITAAADVTLTGQLRIGGGAQGAGGELDLSAAGNVSVTGDIDLSGGSGGGGVLDIEAGGSLTLAKIDLFGSGDDGDAGQVFISAGGNVSFLGVLDARGSDSGENCGTGADVDVTAAGDITISANMDLQGRGLDCTGGTLTLDATRVFVQKSIDLSGTGTEGDGGDLDVSASTFIRLADTVAVDGGQGGAGDFSFESSGEIEILAGIKAQGRTSTSPGGSFADITAGKLTVASSIDTSGGGTAVPGADLTLSACDVIAPAGADLKSTGSAGSITIVARDTLVLRGRFRASAGGGNTLRYSQKANPPDTAGTLFSPAATHVIDATLTPCQLCDTSADCDDGSACTLDTCSGGTCVGTPIDCSDGDPCTDDTCSAGVCGHPLNTAPCADGDPCTSNDRCSDGNCIGGPPTDCTDHDVCTADSCQSVMGCTHAPIAGCVDSDRDEKRDELDECTTLSWTPQPATPPNQNPLGFALILSRLTAPDGARMLIKGLFNAAPSSQEEIDPTTHGVHIHAEDAAGLLIDVSIPGGGGCAASDGWITQRAGSSATWRYRNASGAVPPGCAPGSAHGIESVQIRDRRSNLKAALQFKIKAKNAALLRAPAPPLTRLQVSLALAAQPAPGAASSQAQTGQCAEALFTGNPISMTAKPYCKPKVKSGVVTGLRCKGQ